MRGTDAEANQMAAAFRQDGYRDLHQRVVGDQHHVAVGRFNHRVPQPHIPHLADAVFGLDPHSLMNCSIGMQDQSADHVDQQFL